MKGLLYKDFRLLVAQKQFFLTLLLVAIVLVGAGQDVFFVVSYASMLASFFTVSTISYDEFNNGYPFLFTLPISRAGYVKEKYLFALLLGGGVWVISTAASAVYLYFKDPAWIQTAGEWLEGAVIIFLVLGIVMALMLPVQLKFGAEKARLISFLYMVVLIALFAIVEKIGNWLAPDMSLAWIANMDIFQWTLLGAAAFAIVVLISMTVSMRIMEKKQF